MGKNANFVSHKKSKLKENGGPKLPLASDLVEGEIAINFGKDVETLSIRNESGDVVTFSSDNYYTEQKLGSGFTGENSAVTVTDTILWVSGTGENAIVQKGGGNTASGKLSVAMGSGTTASGDLSVAEGENTLASGRAAHAEGNGTSGTGYFSHAEGLGTRATSNFAHAEGNGTLASGTFSHAEGYSTTASGSYSHAEGNSTTASGNMSHAEGLNTSAMTNYSHAEGDSTVASGQSSHAEGYSTSAINYSHAEGYGTLAVNYSHAEGSNTTARGNSHAEGYQTKANGSSSHAEGRYTETRNEAEHASGQYNISNSASTIFGDSGNTLFSVGNGTADNARHNAFEIRQNGDIYIVRSGNTVLLQDEIGNVVVDQVIDSGTSASTNAVSTKAVYDAVTDNELVWTNAFVALSGTVSAHTANTEIHVTAADKARWDSSSDSLWVSGTGENAIVQKDGGNTASGKLSVAEGKNTTASDNFSHAEGYRTSASGNSSHAEGYRTSASGQSSHAEGDSTIASGNYSHAEGGSTKANGDSSHAEGDSTTASGNFSHAEGQNTIASGQSSHAEGSSTSASGYTSHAEGLNTKANSSYSHAEGHNTVANNQSEHASGQYNVSSSSSTTFGDSGNTLFSVGNGTATNARHNAFEIRQNGDIYITSGGTASSGSIKLQDSIGSKADKTSDLDGLKLKKITQAAYDALVTKDPNTLYVIVN